MGNPLSPFLASFFMSILEKNRERIAIFSKDLAQVRGRFCDIFDTNKSNIQDIISLLDNKYSVKILLSTHIIADNEKKFV